MANNTSSYDDDIPRKDSLFDPSFDPIVCALALLIVLVNSLVPALFATKPYLRLREITNYFLVSLSISDLLTGLLVIPVYLTCIFTRSDRICFTFDMLHRLTAFSTVYHLMVITCDRFVAITRPFQHATLFGRKTVVLTLFFIWSFSLMLTVIQLAWYNLEEINIDGEGDGNHARKYDMACLFLAFVLPVSFMTAVHVRVFGIVMKHARAIGKQNRLYHAVVTEIKSLIIFSLMIGVYLVCWLSYFLLALNDGLGENGVEISEQLEDFLFAFRFCSSALNPLLYVFFKHDFKRAVIECCPKFLRYRFRRASNPSSNTTSSNKVKSRTTADIETVNSKGQGNLWKVIFKKKFQTIETAQV